MTSSILIVERDAAFMYAVERTFRDTEFHAVSVASAGDALAHMDKSTFVAMILHPSVENAESILDRLREMKESARPMVIAVSGGGREVIERLDPELVNVFLSKPVEVQDLLKLVRRMH